MTRSQALTARALLGWSPQRLAEVSGVPFNSVITLERLGSAEAEYKRRIRAALEQAGVVFLENGMGPGVKLKKQEG